MIANFNSNDLTVIPFVEIDRRNVHELPKRKLASEAFARGDGEKLVRSFFGTRQIDLEGHIAAPDRQTFEVARDELLSKLTGSNSVLVVDYGTSSRIFYATMSNVIFTQLGFGLATFTISFDCSNPFGYDPSNTNLTFSNPITAATADSAITIDGSWLSEPRLEVILNSGTGISPTKTITITNTANGEFISVTRSWTALDSLVIDVANHSVTVNNTAVDYLGVFPRWQPGSGILRYSDDFTTRNVTLSGRYVKRYL